jgi:hypothetical protein
VNGMRHDASSAPDRHERATGHASDAASFTLQPGFQYRVQLTDGDTCRFDLSQPRQIWVCPPPPPVERLRTSRHDWMLVMEEQVTLRREQPTTVRVFEEAGFIWTYISAPPGRIIATSKSASPVTVEWE